MWRTLPIPCTIQRLHTSEAVLQHALVCSGREINGVGIDQADVIHYHERIGADQSVVGEVVHHECRMKLENGGSWIGRHGLYEIKHGVGSWMPEKEDGANT
jgi:hypothetical protein